MTNSTVSHFCYKRGGTDVTVTIEHPLIDPLRKEAIDYFVANGCRFSGDPTRVPPWLAGLDVELQRLIVKEHLELMSLYNLHIPDNATIQSDSLEMLSALSDLKHLFVAVQTIRPEHMQFLGYLTELEVLILIGKGFSDDHVSNIPKLPHLRMIDIQTTATTSPAAQRLQHEFPSARIWK